MSLLLASAAAAETPATDCKPIATEAKDSGLSASGTYQGTIYVFQITVDGKPLDDDQHAHIKPTACPLTS